MRLAIDRSYHRLSIAELGRSRDLRIKPLPVKAEQFDPELSAGYQVRRCHRRFDRLLSFFLAQHNIKTGFWYYLRVLWIEDGVTQKYLSEKTNVAENTTAAIINAMVAEGLVTRERDEGDRRKLSILLTERGKALEGELLHYVTKINSAATAGIDPVELEQCLIILCRMSQNLAAAFARQQERIPGEV